MRDLATALVDSPVLGNSGQVMARCRAEGRAALVGYLPVGYPSVPASLDAMRALTEGTQGRGVDLVEVGMPYSDPMMDGTAIQHATTRAIERGVRTRDLFQAVEAVAATGTQAMVMIYWGLVERYGVAAFARDLAAAGGSGLITPDLTPDEADDWMVASDEHHLDRVFLVAPSSTPDRLASTTAQCRGWVYATAVMGVTGAREQSSNLAPELVQRVRDAAPQLPVGVGLGISNGRQAAEIGAFADAAIVGSALVKCLLDAEADGDADPLARMRTVVDDLASGIRGE